MGLEQGRHSELVRHNSIQIIKAGMPLIESATTATESRPVICPPILLPSGIVTGQSIFIITSAVNGAVVLGEGTRKDQYISHFSWHVHYNDRGLGIAEIEPDMDTFRYNSVGIGRGVFELGMALVHKVGPLLPDLEVYSVIVDGSSESGHGWTSAAMQGQKGYETSGAMHNKLGREEAGYVFLRKLK